MDSHKILDEHILTINVIDDYLEYRHKCHTAQEIRDVILKELSNLTRRLNALDK